MVNQFLLSKTRKEEGENEGQTTVYPQIMTQALIQLFHWPVLWKLFPFKS